MPKRTLLFDPLPEILEALEPFRNVELAFIPTSKGRALLDCTSQTWFNYARKGIIKLTKVGNVTGIMVKDLLEAMESHMPPTRPPVTKKRKRKG